MLFNSQLLLNYCTMVCYMTMSLVYPNVPRFLLEKCTHKPWKRMKWWCRRMEGEEWFISSWLRGFGGPNNPDKPNNQNPFPNYWNRSYHI